MNILGEGHQALSDCFAGGPALHAKAELCGASWVRGATGLPILVDSIASLECTVEDVHPAGDHDLYIARVDAAATADEKSMPLLYYSGRYLRIERASTHELEGKPEK